VSKKNQRKIHRSGSELCILCKRKSRLVLHHLRGRELKDWNGDWNRLWVCGSCHDEIHFGDIIIEGWLGTSGGKELFWHKKGEESITGHECKPPLYKDK
jgi:hypothetical protein